MASDFYGVALDAPVVLEVGSAFIRVGLAGEATPRHIVPSPLADWFPAAKSPAQVDDYCDEATATTHPEETVDEDSSGNNAKKSLLFRQYTCSQWIAQLTPLLSDIIYGKLLIKPKSRRILILEPMVAPTNFRNAIAHILFVKFGFPSLLFVPGSSSVSCFSIGANHGLVVDVGHAEARCAIIFGGRYVPQTFHG
jgi:actin-related protein 10